MSALRLDGEPTRPRARAAPSRAIGLASFANMLVSASTATLAFRRPSCRAVSRRPVSLVCESWRMSASICGVLWLLTGITFVTVGNGAGEALVVGAFGIGSLGRAGTGVTVGGGF